MEHQNTPVTPPVGGAGPIEPPVKARVSDVLRATRLRLGVDLGAVATTLHIRVSFLEAIEAGNYDALPGDTYAVGFIRSYGEQLGLDGVELVRRFKQETGADAAVKPEQPNFPTPVKTGGLPFGAIATGIAVAAGLGFAGWYLIAGGDSATTLLPRIPAALNEKITAPPSPPRTEVTPSAAPEAAPVAPEPPTPVAEAPAPEPPVAMTPPPAKPEAAKPAPTKTEAPKTEAPKPVAPKPEPAKPEAPQAAAPVAPPAAAPAAPAPAKPVAVPAAPPRPVVDETTDAPPATPDTLNRQARVYGEENAGARIELVASADAWVQVTENGSLVLTRLMHAGDRFLVPNRTGLTLMTGNAGGLSVLVDGQKAPPLGAQGQVVRDVSLSAERLRGGR